GSSADAERAGSEHARPVITRRDFIAGAGIGVAGTAVVAGGVALVTRSQTAPVAQTVQTVPGGPAVAVPPAPAPAPAQAPPAQAQPQPAAQPAVAAPGPPPRRRLSKPSPRQASCRARCDGSRSTSTARPAK